MARNLGFDVARSVSMMYIVGVLHLSGYTGMSVAENTVFVSFIWSALGVFTFLSSFLLASKWLFLYIYTPENGVAIWAYLFCLAFPVTLYLGYWIQRLYDSLYKK